MDLASGTNSEPKCLIQHNVLTALVVGIMEPPGQWTGHETPIWQWPLRDRQGRVSALSAHNWDSNCGSKGWYRVCLARGAKPIRRSRNG